MVLADLDHNGKLETLLLVEDGPTTNLFNPLQLHVFQPDGTERPGFPVGLASVSSSELMFSHMAVGDLNRDELEKLYATIRRVLREAIARNLMAEGPAGSFPDDWLSGHRERGGRCPRCRTLLTILRSGGRTGYFCPRCQTRRSARC